jgi:hypothetical protein
MSGRRPDRTPSISQRVYEVLLMAYPREFRREYGPQMAQIFRDLCRDGRQAGTSELAGLWVRTVLDLATTAFVERSKAMRWKFLMPVALVLGLLIALVDSSPNWDDTGITAAAVFGSCGALSAIHPRRAWKWALAVGLWIPALGIALYQNYESWAALAVALVGAYAGKLARSAIAARA